MTNSSCIAGIDVGTTGTKCVIFDLTGKPIAEGYVEYSVDMPATGWVEQDPIVWWQATIESFKRAVRKASIRSDRVKCLGFSGQTNSPCFIGEEGISLRPSISWMDTRSAPQANRLRKEIGEITIHKTTGVKADPFYSTCKLLWVKENQPRIWEQTRVILQPKDYVGFKLTGRPVLDKALASSSGFLDINKGKYASELLEEMGLPPDKLPDLVLPTDIVGTLTKEAAELMGIHRETPIVAGSGDVIVNAVGSGVIDVGQAYNKTATASDLVVCTDRPVFDPKLRTVSYLHVLQNKWLLVGGASGGVCYRWFRDNFILEERENAERVGRKTYEDMDLEAGNVESGSRNLVFLPYLTGVRSPIWDNKARGVFLGITLEHKKAHFIRSILEGIAYSVRHRILVMEKELGIQIHEVRVVGGGARSKLWRQIMADIYGKNVSWPKVEKEECFGAAILAGMSLGMYEDLVEASRELVSIADRSKPLKKNRKKYEELFKVYVKGHQRLKDLFDTLSALDVE